MTRAMKALSVEPANASMFDSRIFISSDLFDEILSLSLVGFTDSHNTECFFDPTSHELTTLPMLDSA